MSVQNGNPVSAPVTNAAFISRTQNSSTVGTVAVNNATDSSSPTTGAVTIQGGLGVTKRISAGADIIVDGGITSAGPIQADNGLQVIGNASVSLALNVGTTVTALDLTASNNIDATNNITGATLSGTTVTGTTVNATTQNTSGTATIGTLDVTGNAVIGGNLTVNGTTTTVNSATLEVTDKNILVNNGGTDATAEGAGLSVEGTGNVNVGAVLYDSTLASKFKVGAPTLEAEIVTVSHTQTLTNKTLTSPAITTPTGITKADVGLGNVDNTSDATKNSATATLTNKTITAPVISSIVNSGTLTLPTSTDTLVGRATTDTLTNKSISGSTNTLTNIPLTTAVTGTLPIANGGTNATSANAALNNLLPSQATNTGKYLTTDGTNSSWATVSTGSGDVTSNTLRNSLGAYVRNNLAYGSLTNIFTNFPGTTESSFRPGTAQDIDKLASKVTFSAARSITKVTFSGYYNGSGQAGNVVCRIYADSAGTVGTLLGTSTYISLASLTGVANADIVFNFPEPLTVATATSYWVQIQIEATPTGYSGANFRLRWTQTDGTLAYTEAFGTTYTYTGSSNDRPTFKVDGAVIPTGSIIYMDENGKATNDPAKLISSLGSGGGGVNFISNPNADTGTTGWFGDSFAAASRPSGALLGVGTGVTFTTSASNSLDGTNSFIFSKDAVNRQGRVVYANVNIKPAYFAKVLTVTADYVVDSGTFAAGTSTSDSDVIFYLQNVTDGTFIEPSSFKLLSNSTTIPDKFQATFQTAAAATSYRLLIYVSSTSVNSYSIKFDNISVSPSTYVYGASVTDWQSYTPTGSWTTNTTYTGRYRRVGDSIEMDVTVSTTGLPNATALTVNMPAGITIDTAKLSSTNQARQIGWADVLDGSIKHDPALVLYLNSGAFFPTMMNAAGTNVTEGSQVSNTNPHTFGAGDAVYFKGISVPVVGWSSSVQMSSDAGNSAPVAVAASMSASQTIPTGTAATKVAFDTIVNGFNSIGTFNTTLNRFTANKPGYYRFSGQLNYTHSSLTYEADARLYVNGAIFKYNNSSKAGTAAVPLSVIFDFFHELKAGDYVEIFTTHNAGSSLNIRGNPSAQDLSNLNIQLVGSGNQAIAASENLSARYSSASGQSLPGSGVATIIDFGTVTFDSHGSVTTGAAWKFTAQTSGEYEVSVKLRFGNNQTWTANGYAGFTIYKNGSAYSFPFDYTVVSTFTNANSGLSLIGMDKVKLLAGEYIDIRVQHNETTNRTLLAAGAYNFINVKRVGNY